LVEEGKKLAKTGYGQYLLQLAKEESS